MIDVRMMKRRVCTFQFVHSIIDKLKCVCEKIANYKHKFKYRLNYKQPDHHLNFVLNAEFHIPGLGGEREKKAYA